MRSGFSMVTIFRPTILLAIALMAVIVMMILPVPAFLLDLGLAVSFALAILILTVTLFIDRPLDFSAFPTILLASLLLRLSLNVSSTKLIIGEGHTGTDAAGHVIAGFAEFIMGGNLILGVVIFIVLLIVNFIVITKGAGRMAEVACVTPRHLSRLFREHVRATPHDYLQDIRFALAERAIGEGRATKQAVAEAGIGGTRQWRRMKQRRS